MCVDKHHGYGYIYIYMYLVMKTCIIISNICIINEFVLLKMMLQNDSRISRITNHSITSIIFNVNILQYALPKKNRTSNSISFLLLSSLSKVFWGWWPVETHPSCTVSDVGIQCAAWSDDSPEKLERLKRDCQKKSHPENRRSSSPCLAS